MLTWQGFPNFTFEVFFMAPKSAAKGRLGDNYKKECFRMVLEVVSRAVDKSKFNFKFFRK